MPLTPSSPRISFDIAGESGPPVLLIMGFGMSGALWEPQIEALSGAHRVATYDHLGLGGSERPTRAPTTRRMARDAARVLDALDWTDAHVVGVSMGGMIAQELALLAPTRLRSLTLIATHPGGVLAALPPLAGLARFVQANTSRPEGRVRALARLLYTPEFLRSPAGARVDARLAQMAGRRAPRETVLGHLGAVARHRAGERLGDVRAPTLVVRPGRDILIRPRNSDDLAARIPGARLLRLDDAGHGVTFEKADALNAALAAHIADAEARQPTARS
ncbi:MAG: alpha/beta hydrolase [Polyangiaceae bacterium]|nr:alpha/beta hydrolase [Polyangiaceae bacterium]